MKYFWLGMAWLTASIGMAQLVLPDFFVEEEGDGPEQREPVVDGAHSRGETPGEGLKLEQPMRQMMQAMQVRRQHTGQVERFAEEGEAWYRQEFREGPAELTMELIGPDGRSVRLQVPNQTLTVLTRAGRLPIRLQDIEEIRNAGEAMVIRLRDADQVTGHVERIFLPMREEPGHVRALPLEEIRLIRLSLPE
jgi:hypothetical protein